MNRRRNYECLPTRVGEYEIREKFDFGRVAPLRSASATIHSWRNRAQEKTRAQNTLHECSRLGRIIQLRKVETCGCRTCHRDPVTVLPELEVEFVDLAVGAAARARAIGTRTDRNRQAQRVSPN